MKFTLNWLKDYLDTDATLEQITDKLTDIGLEVEGIDELAVAKESVVEEPRRIVEEQRLRFGICIENVVDQHPLDKRWCQYCGRRSDCCDQAADHDGESKANTHAATASWYPAPRTVRMASLPSFLRK